MNDDEPDDSLEEQLEQAKWEASMWRCLVLIGILGHIVSSIIN